MKCSHSLPVSHERGIQVWTLPPRTWWSPSALQLPLQKTEVLPLGPITAGFSPGRQTTGVSEGHLLTVSASSLSSVSVMPVTHSKLTPEAVSPCRLCWLKRLPAPRKVCGAGRQRSYDGKQQGPSLTWACSSTKSKNTNRHKLIGVMNGLLGWKPRAVGMVENANAGRAGRRLCGI